jgi:hypothetical protein
VSTLAQVGTLYMTDERAATRRRGPVVGAVLIYVAPLLLLFVVEAVGLWRVPNQFVGMYANDDGFWAAWNVQGILEWGLPFDLAPFNPLSGMGSTFLPNTPWFNPAALALALPLPREIGYLISYFVYFAELSASVVLLFRVMELTRVEAIFATELYLFLIFPPMAYFSAWGFRVGTLTWSSLAPVNLHLVAISNLLVILVLAIGRGQLWYNVACGIGVVLLVLCGVLSAPITFLTYAPMYSIFGAALVLGSQPNIKQISWKVGAIIITAALFWLAGFKDYLQGTASISSRTVYFPGTFAAGEKLLSWSNWRNAWSAWGNAWPGIDACSIPLPLCGYLIFYLYIAALAGAVWCAIQGRRKLKIVAVGTLIFSALLHLYDFANYVTPQVISPQFFAWSGYLLVALFSSLLMAYVLQLVQASTWSSHLVRQVMTKGAASKLGSALFILVIPGIALAWELRLKHLLPPPPVNNPEVHWLGQSSIRRAELGTITQYLIEHARITPGAVFRGYTTTYLADPAGPLAMYLQKPGASPVATYVAARYFFDQHYRNRLQETDLWELNIPTIEEYGQWVTKPAYLAFNALFPPSGNSGAASGNDGVFLRIYSLDIDLLALFGVRYIITDTLLHDKRTTLRAVQTASDAPMIQLYEIGNPDLGALSPTQFATANSFDDAIAILRDHKFDMMNTAVVFDPLEGTLGPAQNVTFRFVRGGFHVTADAAGDAAIVLPVQYSKCWRAVGSQPAAGIRLYRANALQTLLRFTGHIDATFHFVFGRLGGTACRSQDLAQLKSIGLE